MVAGGGGLTGGLPERLFDSVEALVDGGQEELLLGGKQREDVWLRDADAPGDHLRGGAVEAVERKLGHGRFEHLGAALLGGVTRIAALFGRGQSSHVSDYSLSSPDLSRRTGGLPGGDQEVADLEGARLVRWQGRPPGWVVGEIGFGVATNDADDDFGDDTPADIAEVVATVADCGFAEDVQPQRCLILPVAQGELLACQGRCADGASDRFTGRQARAHSALEVPRRKRSVGAHLDDPGNGFRKPNERRGQLAIDRF